MNAADLVLLRVRTLEEERDALVDALRLLSTAIERHGVCVCGHDGELVSADCPLHGIGAIKASKILTQVVEKSVTCVICLGCKECERGCCSDCEEGFCECEGHECTAHFACVTCGHDPHGNQVCMPRRAPGDGACTCEGQKEG